MKITIDEHGERAALTLKDIVPGDFFQVMRDDGIWSRLLWALSVDHGCVQSKSLIEPESWVDFHLDTESNRKVRKFNQLTVSAPQETI